MAASVHDNVLVSYEVLCEERKIVLHTEFRERKPPEQTTVVFTGVEAYHFKNDTLGSVVFDVATVPVADFIAQNRAELLDVEIGGAVPYVDNAPPPKMIDGLVKGQVPWVFEIAKGMARIRIADTAIKRLGSGVYEVKVWVENTGGLPSPTAMGRRNERILPVVVGLSGPGLEILEGKARNLVPAVPAHGAQLVKWIVRAAKPVKLEVKADTRIAWGDSRTLDLGGVK